MSPSEKINSAEETGLPEDGQELKSAVEWALPVQAAWAILSFLWNIAGVLLISRGLRAPGPTASWVAAGVLFVIAAALFLTVKKLPLAYLLLSFIGGLMALLAVKYAFTADPSLWPSEFWRWAGIALNGAGTAGAVAGVLGFFKWNARARFKRK